jgi:xanthine dehydrogenase YagR molybdenum-binding subunit
VSPDDERAQATAEQPEKFVGREKLQVKRGDPAAVLANADVHLEAAYETPIENHNPIETFATIAVWEDRDRLLLYEATRWIKGIQEVVATAFALPAENVRVVAPFVGGAFGSKGFTWSHILLTAAAARLVDRPVKLNFSRHQMFDSAGQRAHTRQTFRMAAGRDGRLTAIQHDTVTHCSPLAQYTESCGTMTRRLYACPNVGVTHTLLHLNLTTPCPMRAPGEAPGVFALECAMDEMAERLGLDPLEFRLRNYAEADPEEERPWSSKQLRLCYQQGAERFGWAKRPPAPRSMQTRDGKFIGWGMALLEQTVPDVRTGRNVNPNLAEYFIPVCADTPAAIDLSVLGVPDPHMPEPGARGIGEIGIVGTAAAIANAVYHATGRRVRELPITPDKLL